MIEAIERLQAEMVKLPQSSDFITKHYFADGMYCRALWRPAGTLIVGKVHKKEHFYIVASGTVHVTMGDRLQKMTGFDIAVSSPGTKRAVLAMTDAWCITVHRTDETDLDAIEADLVLPDSTALFGPGNVPLQLENV
jgi:hypothetical protein